MQRKLNLVAPDGGWGWAVLCAAVMVNILIPGTIKSFGVLFVEFMRVFEATPTEASWMPALCYFLYSSLGPLSSFLSMKYSYRSVTLVGGSFAAGGLMLSYFANSVMFLYFSYGIMVGVGAGLSFPVTIYIVSEYFDKRRGLATGLCISGSCIGTIMLPPLIQFLLDTIGYRLAVLVLGGILVTTILVAFLYEPVERHMKLVPDEGEDTTEEKKEQKDGTTTEKSKEEEIGEPSVSLSHRGSIVSIVGPVTLDPKISLSRRLADKQRAQSIAESIKIAAPAVSAEAEVTDKQPKTSFLEILKDPLYLVILISNSTSAISNTNFMILLPLYASAEGHDKDSAALLLSIVSLLDLIGRIGGAALSDMNLIPKHYYFVSGLGLSGVALALLPMGENYLYLASFCALFGLSSGLYIGTTAVVLADMLGPERLSSSYGISLFVNGVLQLVGPPVCNMVFEIIGSFKPIFMSLGMILVCGTALWGALPIIKRRSESEGTKKDQNPA